MALAAEFRIFKPGNHISKLGSAAMTFTSHRTLGATILVSHFTSAHTNIYSKHAEQPYLFCPSQLYYSKNRPLRNANCPLLPQSGMQTAGKFAVLTWLNACDTKMFLGLHVLLILSSGCERVAREMPRNCSSLPKLGL